MIDIYYFLFRRFATWAKYGYENFWWFFRWRQAGPFEIGGVLRDHEGNFPYVLFRKVPDIMIFFSSFLCIAIILPYWL